MFCVECGKEQKLFGGLCSDCFLKKNVFITIPKNIDVEVCVHCGSWKKKKNWVTVEDGNLISEVLLENLKRESDVSDFDMHITQDFEDEKNINVDLITHSTVLGLKAEEKHSTKVRIKRTVCSECSKQQGGYWEAKVQLRGGKRRLDENELDWALEVVDTEVSIREKKHRDAFISKVEKVHGGLDFYFGSNNLGKNISKRLASEFGGSIKESRKLVGRKDGNDIYRMTYAVRASDFQVGDFLELNSKVMKVLSVSSNKVYLKSLDSWEDVHLKPEDLASAKLLGGEEIVKEMVVVSRSDSEIQVLDPDTLKTVDVLVPEGFEVDGESVKIVKFEEGYFLVGED
jgi:nonsense-mediated mRNA decay protein 3